MGGILRSSEAASLALHAAGLLAEDTASRLRVKELAARLKVSAAHLAKVLQRLEQAGIVVGARGPNGGYRLARAPQRVSLVEVYEAVAGPLAEDICPFRIPVCAGNGCLLGSFFRSVSRKVTAQLAGTRLSDIKLSLKQDAAWRTGGRK